VPARGECRGTDHDALGIDVEALGGDDVGVALSWASIDSIWLSAPDADALGGDRPLLAPGDVPSLMAIGLAPNAAADERNDDGEPKTA